MHRIATTAKENLADMSLRFRRYCECYYFNTTTECGWWRPSGPNWLLPTQSSKLVSTTRVRNGIFCCRDRAAKRAHSARLQEQRPRSPAYWADMPVRSRRYCESRRAYTTSGWG